jgi:hypothetical protein
MSTQQQQAPTSTTFAASLAVRICYVLALASIVLPMPVSIAVAMYKGHPGPRLFFIPMLLAVLLAGWRSIAVLRDPRRLDAPAVSGVLKWFQRLAIALMVIGAVSFVVRWLVVPITHLGLQSQSGAGGWYVVISIWLSVFSVLTSGALLLFEGIRLFALEAWYGKSRSSSAWSDTQ